MPSIADIKKIIDGMEQELAKLQLQFTGKQTEYSQHIEQGKQIEINLNQLGLEMEKKQSTIDEFREKFNVPKKKIPGVPRLKRTAKKHIKKEVKK